MDYSNAQHHLHRQETFESICIYTKSQQKEKSKPPVEQAQKYPRCDSTNTKFCYYNNYSLSQPMYFCKSCRRYWTKGGTLRNIPIGGGCRNNRRSSSCSSKTIIQESLPSLVSVNSNLTFMSPLVPPLLSYDSNNLTLDLAWLESQNSGLHEFPMMGNIGNISCVNSFPSTGLHELYDGIRSGYLENTPNGFNNFFNGNNMNNGNMWYADIGGLGLGMYFKDMNGGTIASSTDMTNYYIY